MGQIMVKFASAQTRSRWLQAALVFAASGGVSSTGSGERVPSIQGGAG